LTQFRPKGRHPKQILNEIKWRGLSLDECEIDILHRGAPNDTITVKGGDVVPGKSFFSYGGTMIPYHRILRIKYLGDTIWSRSK